MTGTQRIKAMLNGNEIDRPGVSIWKHIYLEDRHPKDFVKRTLEIRNNNDWDFIKVCYNGYLVPEAFGAQIEWISDSNTFPTMLKHPVNHPRDWLSLKNPGASKGAYRREIEAIARMIEAVKGSVPVLPTIFSPLTAAQELSCGWKNPWPIIQTMKHSPKELHKGLEVITDSILDFLNELVGVGMDGIFFATHLACHCRTTPALYEEFGKKYDLMVLNHIKDKTWFNMLHNHGQDSLFFEEILDYPVQVLNWEDVSNNISMKYACENSDKILIGGIEQWDDLYEPDRDKFKERMRKRLSDCLESVPANRLIFAPECCVPTDVPEYRLTVIKEVVMELLEK